MPLVSFQLSSSPFTWTGIHPESDTHNASQWQVDSIAGNFTGVPFYDSGWSTVDLLAHITPALFEIGTGWLARVRHRDVLEEEGAWSDPMTVGLPRKTLEQAWAFTFDGHIFYVLNFVLEASLVYDMTTGQWCRWSGQPFWNMFRGIVWKGSVLACGIEDNRIWELDPHSALDEGVTPVTRKVTGFQSLRGSASQRQGSLRVSTRKQDAAQSATMTMRFSDDNGKTWSAARSVVLAGNSYSQRVEWRSLGRIRAPGRLWEISDTGGFVRIEGADADLEGEE